MNFLISINFHYFFLFLLFHYSVLTSRATIIMVIDNGDKVTLLFSCLDVRL